MKTREKMATTMLVFAIRVLAILNDATSINQPLFVLNATIGQIAVSGILFVGGDGLQQNFANLL
jgi:hypothetical protein